MSVMGATGETSCSWRRPPLGKLKWSKLDAMTIQTDRVQEIFQDARFLQAAAVERLDQGDIRDAAEKAWGATKRATDALILARNGEEPELTGQTSDGLLHLDADDNEVRRVRLLARYFTRQGHLHGRCFYNGHCNPLEETERRIRETADYIEDAQRLAGIA